MGRLVHYDLMVTGFSQNCRVISYAGGREAVVIDPGGESSRIVEILKAKQLTLTAIWLTHSHLDHCGGVAALKRYADVPLSAHPIEAPLRARVVEIGQMYGADEDLENCPEPEQSLRGGEQLTFGPLSFEVLFTPGHSPGHLCFYEKSAKALIAGDAVFAGSIGRTDLPGGDSETLLASIHQKILTLPADTVIMSGHGPDTTVGEEARSNPFLS